MEARRALKEYLGAGAEHGLAQEGGFGEVLLGQFAQPFLAVNGQEDRDHHGDERLVGADVRSRFFAADVLLAC